MSAIILTLIGIFLITLIAFVKSNNSKAILKNISVSEVLSYFSSNLIIILNITLFTSYVIYPISEILAIALYTILQILLYFFLKGNKSDTLFTVVAHNKVAILVFLSLINIFFTICAFIFIETIKQHISYILILDLYFVSSTILGLYLCHTLYLKQKMDNLKLCNKTILTLYDDTRAFKHDFNNIIQAIGGYIDNKNFDGLQKYYKDILKDCKDLNNRAKLNPELINNPAIYNILANKYYIANNNNIAINLEILLDLNQLNIRCYDFSRVLGILLDNAIEASKECTTKNINISFRKDNSKQMLIIENTYNDNQISIDKIFDKNFTTKPHNTGLGLWEVRKILKKYSNLNLHTSKNDSYFSQQLEIYNTG